MDGVGAWRRHRRPNVLGQDKLVDAALPTGVLRKTNQSNECCLGAFSGGTILVRHLSSPNIP
jgi:hypothetical protein